MIIWPLGRLVRFLLSFNCIRCSWEYCCVSSMILGYLLVNIPDLHLIMSVYSVE